MPSYGNLIQVGLQMEHGYYFLIRSEESPDQPQQRRLAGAVFAGDSQHFAGTQRKIDRSQPEVMALPFNHFIGSDEFHGAMEQSRLIPELEFHGYSNLSALWCRKPNIVAITAISCSLNRALFPPVHAGSA